MAAEPMRTGLEYPWVGYAVAGTAGALMVIGMVGYLLFIRRLNTFPVKGREAKPYLGPHMAAHFSFCGLWILYGAMGEALPCPVICWWYSFCVNALASVYCTRCWKLLCKFKVTAVLIGLNKIQMMSGAPGARGRKLELERLTNDWFLRHTSWTKSAFIWRIVGIDWLFTLAVMIPVSILDGVYLGEPCVGKSRVSGMFFMITNLLLVFKAAFCLVCMCLLRNYDDDGYKIRMELRVTGFSLIAVVVLELLRKAVLPYSSYYAGGAWSTLVGWFVMFSLGLYYPVLLSYQADRQLRLNEKEDLYTVLQNPERREQFEQFVALEFSSENLIFWDACSVLVDMLQRYAQRTQKGPFQVLIHSMAAPRSPRTKEADRDFVKGATKAFVRHTQNSHGSALSNTQPSGLTRGNSKVSQAEPVSAASADTLLAPRSWQTTESPSSLTRRSGKSSKKGSMIALIELTQREASPLAGAGNERTAQPPEDATQSETTPTQEARKENDTADTAEQGIAGDETKNDGDQVNPAQDKERPDTESVQECDDGDGGDEAKDEALPLPAITLLITASSTIKEEEKEKVRPARNGRASPSLGSSLEPSSPRSASMGIHRSQSSKALDGFDEELADVARYAEDIYNKFIHTGGDLEVNVGAKIRSDLRRCMDAQVATAGLEGLHELLELLMTAREEIYSLMAADTFNRFLLKEKRQLTKARSMIEAMETHGTSTNLDAKNAASPASSL